MDSVFAIASSKPRGIELSFSTSLIYSVNSLVEDSSASVAYAPFQGKHKDKANQRYIIRFKTLGYFGIIKL